MMVQDMIQETLTYDQKTMEWIPDTTDRRKLFEKAHKKAWLSYCWGVWTTARQRLSLHEAISSTYNEKTGMWDAFYWDTDSVKFIDPDGIHAAWFKKKNEELITSRTPHPFGTTFSLAIQPAVISRATTLAVSSPTPGQ